jgi:hypothetical protein
MRIPTCASFRAAVALAAFAGAQLFSDIHAQTNLLVTVRHAPTLNGAGLIEGSVHQLLGENVSLGGGFTTTGDLLVPGTPTLVTKGNPTFGGVVPGSGSATPGGYNVTLNGNISLRYLRTRTTPVSLPVIPPPATPAGTRSVTITSAGQSIGDPATLRNLTLDGTVGQVYVPPGTYGNFVIHDSNGLTLGVTNVITTYNLQNLTLHGNARIQLLGPIVLTVANGFSAHGLLGNTNQSAWLQLQLATAASLSMAAALSTPMSPLRQAPSLWAATVACSVPCAPIGLPCTAMAVSGRAERQTIPRSPMTNP